MRGGWNIPSTLLVKYYMPISNGGVARLIILSELGSEIKVYRYKLVKLAYSLEM